MMLNTLPIAGFGPGMGTGTLTPNQSTVLLGFSGYYECLQPPRSLSQLSENFRGLLPRKYVHLMNGSAVRVQYRETDRTSFVPHFDREYLADSRISPQFPGAAPGLECAPTLCCELLRNIMRLDTLTVAYCVVG